MEKYDVIVVGLGCWGLSAAYTWAKNGMKVLGLEMNPSSGYIGTSSYGETRLWRTNHGSKFKNDMMEDALFLWKEMEEESGEQLIVNEPILAIGSSKNNDFDNMKKQFPDAEYLTPAEIMSRYPALKNIPDHYVGIISEKCGIVKAKVAIETTKKLAEEKYGAKLLYNTKVKRTTQNSVTTEEGTTYSSDHVVVATGAYTAENFDNNQEAKRLEVEWYYFQDVSGLPGAFIERPDGGGSFYGMLDGPNFDQFKMGSFFKRDFKRFVDYFKLRMPEKLDSLKFTTPCYFTMTDTGESQYKTGSDGVHYAYGFNGGGFKFLPLHGKIIYDGLINKTDQTYIPPRFRSKM